MPKAKHDTPKLYSFIKVSNNHFPKEDFTIHLTCQKNYKLAMSVLKTRYKMFAKGHGGYHELYHYFSQDYSYYCLDRKEFNNLAEAKEYADKLHEEQFDKMNA
jgi:hypothetical protein